MNECKILISGDYNAFNEGWNGMGVYACLGLYESKKLRLPIYIGSSNNLKYRIKIRHFSRLRMNKHTNSLFQNAWNKHGKDRFVWILLEECNDSKQLLELEQLYLDFYRPFIDENGGFNINHIAGKPPNPTGKIVSQETRDKISKANKGKTFLSKEQYQRISMINKGNTYRCGKKMTEEQRMKNRLIRLGTKHTEETKLKMSQAHLGKEIGVEKFYYFINPQGEIVKVWNVRKFCRNNPHLKHSNMYALQNGKLKSYQGWKKFGGVL